MRERPCEHGREARGSAQHAQALYESLEHAPAPFLNRRRYSPREELEQSKELCGKEDERVEAEQQHDDNSAGSGRERAQRLTYELLRAGQTRVEQRCRRQE